MNIMVDREPLAHAVKVVTTAVAGKTALPILSYVLMTAVDTQLTLTGTDLTTALRTSVDAKISASGSIALDPKPLAEWLASVPDGAIEIDVDLKKWRAVFTSGTAKVALAGIDPDDYPVVRSVDDDAPAAMIPAVRFRRMLERVLVATSTDRLDSRPVLTGVKVEIAPDRVFVAGADGYRLSRDRAEMETGISETIRAIVPRPGVVALIGLIDDDASMITLQATGTDNTILLARVNGVEWSSRIVDGTYPDVEQIIRTKHTCSVTVNRMELRAAIRGTRTISAANNDNIFLTLAPDDGTMLIESFSDERGNASRTIPALPDGDQYRDIGRIALDYRFVDQSLGVLASDAVELHFEAPNRPLNITDRALDGHVAVMMPKVIGSAA